jgi:hypothetical protein
MDPNPTGTRVSSPALAKALFALNPSSEPPVIQDIKKGKDVLWPKNATEASTSKKEISGMALWTR